MKAIKIQISLLITLLILTATSCKKDLTSSTDITTSTWSLKSVSTDGEKFKITEGPNLLCEAYELNFSNDSIFVLRTSVNTAGGLFNISDWGDITIENYDEFMEVGAGANAELNENLITVLREVTTYELKGNVLTFFGNEGQIKFRKK